MNVIVFFWIWLWVKNGIKIRLLCKVWEDMSRIKNGIIIKMNLYWGIKVFLL